MQPQGFLAQGGLARRHRTGGGEWHGTLKFVNYLGTAWLGHRQNPLRFEVVTRKLDYEAEYRAMVEAIAAECQQLLLTWDAPTSLSITADPARQARTLLEQFLFLRHVLGPDRLDLFLEMLQRRPHSRLATERHWVPVAAADPRLFIRDPLRHGRDWQRSPSGIVNGFSPGEVCSERKFDTVDTPPNRFVKFALGRFAGLCADVRAIDEIDKNRGSAWLEAGQMETALENLLAEPFSTKSASCAASRSKTRPCKNAKATAKSCKPGSCSTQPRRSTGLVAPTPTMAPTVMSPRSTSSGSTSPW